MESIAKRNNKTAEEIEKIITENDSRENIETELLLDGAMDFIYENAKIKKLKPISFEEFAKSRQKIVRGSAGITHEHGAFLAGCIN